MDVTMYISPETTTQQPSVRPPVTTQGVTTATQALLSLARWMRVVGGAQDALPHYGAQLGRETALVRRLCGLNAERGLPEAFANAVGVLAQMGR